MYQRLLKVDPLKCVLCGRQMRFTGLKRGYRLAELVLMHEPLALTSQSWQANWPNLATFFAYPTDIRKVIYTTNAIESLNICSRYRIRTSIPVTSISAMCPGTAISRLVVIVTAFPKRCVVSRYRYEYRWMTSCGSTVMRNWWPHIASVRHRLAGKQCRSITPRSGSRSVRWNIDH